MYMQTWRYQAIQKIWETMPLLEREGLLYELNIDEKFASEHDPFEIGCCYLIIHLNYNLEYED